MRPAVLVSRPPRSPRALPRASASLGRGLSMCARATLVCDLAGVVVWGGVLSWVFCWPLRTTFCALFVLFLASRARAALLARTDELAEYS